MIPPSKRIDFGRNIVPTQFLPKDGYKARNLKTEAAQQLTENKRYQTQVSWIQETYPPIYNFRNLKLGQFTPSLELEGYEYGRQVEHCKVHNLDSKSIYEDRYPNEQKSLFINNEEYKQQVQNRFKRNKEPQQYIRPLISFKHNENFIENNAIQTITDSKNRKKNQKYSEQVKLSENPSKTRSYNIQHMNDFKQKEEEKDKHLQNILKTQKNIQQQMKEQNLLNENNKLTLKDPHLNYIANNIDKFQQQLNNMEGLK
ncbi:hypothetical protein TTHERM_00989420 (macronuclear) [Tetrahymena thermophila SB210]|uniref:Uncharacterized protein n=1 Tax=Tetrahymena thermophila (strain SB210) TaxID=312017 RepID=Q240K7_TETTS|nr:hypothetical protein TTHERM_00989420 [Tetrahymena thermophila SB210]EAS02201.2 hypothetical protein TTHERM_00989420 [Tetrahymena thermophila SB210]|eukprot:XP_001022446.2 hypothetical protein TTHERM_00989420 [Tetrahymena thermophila SB210]